MALFALAAYLWANNLDDKHDCLLVTILDVGQGEAILIETSGAKILVDGGPSGPALVQALGSALADGDRRIDLVVLSHPQADHLTGLVELADRYEVGAVMEGQRGSGATYAAWRERVEKMGIVTFEAQAGQSIEFENGVRLEILAHAGLLTKTANDINNNSVVLRIVDGDLSLLLTGDLQSEGEAALVRRYGNLEATVLKAGHHGSDGSSSTASSTPFGLQSWALRRGR